MLKSTLALAGFLGAAVLATAADYTAAPLRPRLGAAAGGKAFQRIDAAAAGLTVTNVFDDPRMWGARFRELTLGAVETGVAVADFNGDGRPDIYAVSKNGPCALYLQTDDFRFREAGAQAGVAVGAPSSNTGATAVDINQDGAMDIYVCRYELPNLLFVNNGDGTFAEQGKAWGLDLQDASVHATFADYDRDGHLDCYVVTNILDFSKSPQGRRDVLFRNNGNGTFTDVTAKTGIWGLTQGHSAIWFDANHDGWPDLYVANDFETPDRFYLNNGDGTFADVVDERLPHVTYFSMGADAGDINNDGLVDFFVADMRDRNHFEFMTGMEEIGRGLWEMERVSDLIPQYMWNALYLNTGTQRYAEAAHLAGMAATGWTWSTRFGDLDNDGRLDAFVTAGMIRNFIDADLVDKQNVAPTLSARAKVWENSGPRREATLAYRNLGGLEFADVSSEWGLDESTVAFGCAMADLDGDGDLDLVYANYEAPPTIVRNQTTSGHLAVIRLDGRAPNREGIGAEVVIETSAGTQVRQLYNERGIASSEPALIHFGLGEETTIKQLTVRWPRGQVQVLKDLPADRLLTIKEPALAAEAKPAPAVARPSASASALFAETAAARGLKYAAQFQPYDEFIGQRLLPRRMNGQSPALASADVNADGHADLFVSGAAGQSGQLFLGQADGSFVPAGAQPWSAAAKADDTGATFLDANADGHVDLFIAAGGVQAERGDALLNDRLYLNDGRGQFSAAPAGFLPADGESTGATAAADFDGDGRSDLFVGGRTVPGKYPETPRSFLYRNEGGKFADVTDAVAPGLREIGLVTAALWADVNADQKPDLLVATEWGSVMLFTNNGGKLVSAPLTAATGWWSSLAVADVNGDGRLDVIAGNNGLNTKYHASEREPTELYAGDFDGSGRSHLIEAQHENGKLVPVRGRSKLAYSFPWLSRKFPTYKAFASASLSEIFGADRLAGVKRLAATELASGVFLQQADGTFAFRALPREAQLAPINAIVARDLDGDNHLDLVAVGNNFGPEPSTGRFDGGVGVVLKGDGRGGFTALNAAQSGLLVIGEARAALAVPGAKGARLVVATNQGPLLLFERK